MGYRPHNHHGISVGQRKNNLQALAAIIWYATGGVSPGIQHIAAAQQPAQPGGKSVLTGYRIADAQNFASDSPAGVERAERYVELLQASAEEQSQQGSEGTKSVTPLRPGVQ